MPVWLIIVLLYIANLVGLLSIAVVGSRKPALTLTWMLVGLVLPIFSIALYFGFRGPLPKRSRLPFEGGSPSSDLPDEVASTLDTDKAAPTATIDISHAIQSFSSAPALAHLVAYHSGADFYRDLIVAISRANKSIDMEFYIFRYDEIGRQVVDALLERARSGVQVRLLLDGFGSRAFPQDVVDELRKHSIDYRVHFPLQFPYVTPSTNHRDHCKIVVIDETTAFTGGMNVGREYASLDPKRGPWRDTHVQVRSEKRLALLDLFEANFALAGRGKKDRLRVSPGDLTRQMVQAVTVTPNPEYKPVLGQRGIIQFLQSGPDTPRENLRELFFLCLIQARQQVEITTPYFLPESDVLMALCTAVARGVRVRLLLPERVDHRLVGMACQTFFPRLLDSGVEIYLYRPGVLHAKVMTVDGEVSIVGAANYDIRSFRLNYEVVMVQYGEEFTRGLMQQFETDLLVSRRLTADALHNSLLAQVAHNAARLLSPLM